MKNTYKRVDGMNGNEQERINCYKCRFFRITWEAKFPYACKAHGFKGKNLPSQDVLSASGFFCVCFEPKANKKKRVEKNYPEYI